MLALLLPAAFAAIYFLLESRSPQTGRRGLFLRAAVVWGSYLTFSTELLSIIRGVTRLGLSIAWLIPIALAVYQLLHRAKRGKFLFSRPTLKFPKPNLDWSLWVPLLFVLGVTALVAWLAPPQTWDSLTYHMSRVAHWAQARQVWHYPTGMEIQNSMPPGAEMIVLHTYVLANGDRLVNFVQWTAMLICLVGVARIAKQLGVPPSGQLLAAVLVAALPMGIVQASSTMTDYVLSCWLICAGSEVLNLRDKEQRLGQAIVFANLAAGLALLTKPIAVPYLLPLAGLALVLLLRRMRPLQLVGWSALSLALVLALSAGHLLRNIITYGNPISNQERIDMQGNQLRTIPGMLSNALRNAGLHLGTPKQAVNEWIYNCVLDIHQWMNVDINDPRTTLHGEYNPIGGFATHEDVVGNLLHTALIGLTFCAVLAGGKRLGGMAVVYMLLVIAGFFLFSMIFKWQIFGTRYHTPFFVLFAPLIAYAAVRSLPANAARALGMITVAAAWLWLFSINSRPLVPIEGRSYVGSILHTPRQELYFANASHLEAPFTQMSKIIQEADCRKVGIMLSGSNAEYLLWALMGAPRHSLQIEWIVAGTPSERYEDENFQPCAIICQKCAPDQESIRGLPMIYNRNNYQLYMAPVP
ncbi:MAG: DUF2142 domain-containing protein [Anaerolineales bacterium]|nr:DUF2142 domain-containing protein [Anaerolineales bacterium]